MDLIKEALGSGICRIVEIGPGNQPIAVYMVNLLQEVFERYGRKDIRFEVVCLDLFPPSTLIQFNANNLDFIYISGIDALKYLKAGNIKEISLLLQASTEFLYNGNSQNINSLREITLNYLTTRGISFVGRSDFGNSLYTNDKFENLDTTHGMQAIVRRRI